MRSSLSPQPLPLGFLILLAAAWLAPGLIDHEPWKPDEAYSFGLVYHILQTGDWVVPTLAGEPFVEKPPLFYLTAALFAHLFSAWMPLHDGARFASALYTALTLLFVGLAGRELYARASATVLALLACIGLMSFGQLLITDMAMLSGIALGLYGFALGMRRARLGGLCLGTGIGIAFLSKGLLGPGVLGLTALALPLLHPVWRTRRYLVTLLTAGAAALPWLLVWPLALYLRSTELFMVWLWDNNIGRFFGFSGLGPKQGALFYLHTLPWFAWPCWLLALWGLWKMGRDERRHPTLLLPLAAFAITLLTLTTAADARQVYALPLLLPLALISARAMDFLSGRANTVLYLSGMAATLIALLLPWGVWAALWHGVAVFAALEPVLGVFTVSPLYTAAAALLSAGCLLALYALRQRHERALAAWAIATTLFSGLVLTLLLDVLDHKKSYRDLMLSLRNSLPPGYQCVASDGLGEPQRAMLDYYADIRTFRRSVYPKIECPLLLRQERDDEPVHDPRAWQVLWEGQRPGDSDETFRLYRRR